LLVDEPVSTDMDHLPGNIIDDHRAPRGRMRMLLDTHVFLWYISADPQLAVAFRDAISIIRKGSRSLYLPFSVVS